MGLKWLFAKEEQVDNFPEFEIDYLLTIAYQRFRLIDNKVQLDSTPLFQY